MPTEVGTLREITFVVANNADIPVAKEVRLILAQYADLVPQIKALVNRVPPVKVSIQVYGGSGAVTRFRPKTIVVSRSLPGGDREIVEAVLFELLNWVQGDFTAREHDRVRNGDITPKQGGEAIARCEVYTIYHHGLFMQALKAKNVKLTTYGQRQLAALGGKSQQETEQLTLTSKHDDGAPATDVMSLLTPEMYWYQTVDAVANVAVTLRAVNNPAPWLEEFVTWAWRCVDDPTAGVSGAVMYVKLLNLAEAAGFTLKGGYEFTPAMKIVAKETTVGGPGVQRVMTSALTEKWAPGTLAAHLKTAYLLP